MSPSRSGGNPSTAEAGARYLPPFRALESLPEGATSGLIVMQETPKVSFWFLDAIEGSHGNTWKPGRRLRLWS
jgi:hypothetical protein